MDHLPSREREKIRKRMRSPEEYERLREKVKGPEDLEREMEKNSEFAEAKLHLESDPKAQEKARDVVRAFVKQKGIDAALNTSSANAEKLLQGKFDVIVTEHEHQPTLSVRSENGASGEEAPSGNITETLQLRTTLSKQVLSSFRLK
jgi:hypothetical protein